MAQSQKDLVDLLKSLSKIDTHDVKLHNIENSLNNVGYFNPFVFLSNKNL